MKQRILSIILVVIMVFTSVDITAFAQEDIGVEVGETATEDDEVREEEEQIVATQEPTEEPTAEVTATPEVEPTEEPGVEATQEPTAIPTAQPEETSEIPIPESEKDMVSADNILPAETPNVEMEEPVSAERLEENGEYVYGGRLTDNGADVTWGIDANKKLIINGTTEGSCGSYPWRSYEFITAEVNLTGLEASNLFFASCDKVESINFVNFDTKNIQSMEGMFKGCRALKTLNIENWDTSNVTDMSYMFSGCSALEELNIGNWNTSNVTNMEWMFSSCVSLEELNIENWNTGNVTDMERMFSVCTALKKIDLSKWDMKKVTSIECMFTDCSSLFELGVNGWDLDSLEIVNKTFEKCSALKSLEINDWDVENVKYLYSVFSGCTSLESLDLSKWNVENVIELSFVFYTCKSLKNLDIDTWNVKNLEKMNHVFSYCESLTALNLNQWNTSKVTEMENVFANCSALTQLDIDKWDTGNVTNMVGVFENCISLTELHIENWNTPNVLSTANMFEGCKALKEIDLNNWNVQNLTYTSNMFCDCRALKELDLNNWNISQVTDMSAMFEGCKSLETLKISDWDTSNVKNLNSMFEDCQALKKLDLSGWELPNISNKRSVFSGCDSLNTIHAPLNVKMGESITLPTISGETDDKWYLADGSEVTVLPQGQDYSPVIGRRYVPEETDNLYPPKDVVIDGIEINGRGVGYARFRYVDHNGRIQKQRSLNYEFKETGTGESAEMPEDVAVAVPEESGYITIQTPVLTNTTGEDEEYCLTAKLWMVIPEEDTYKELPYTVTVHAMVKPLSFSQTWELGVESEVEVSIGAEAGVKAGVAEAEAALAEAMLSGSTGGVLSVEHAIDGDNRTLTLLQSYNVQAGGGLSGGLSGEVGALGHDLDVDIASAEAGISAGASGGLGLRLENYNPEDREQQRLIGRFLLATMAPAGQNLLTFKLSELCGDSIHNIEQLGTVINVNGGADIGSIDFCDNVSGTLISKSADRTLTSDITLNKEDDSKEIAFGYEQANDFAMGSVEWETPFGEDGIGIFSDSDESGVELCASYDGDNIFQSFAVTKERVEEDDSISAFEVTYGKEATEDLGNSVAAVKAFIAEDSRYVMEDAQDEIFEALDTTPFEGVYSASVTNKETTASVDLDVGAALGVGLEIGVALEGVKSCEYETASGTYVSGKRYLSNSNEIEEVVAENMYDIGTLMKEALTASVESLKEFINDVGGSIKEGVENAYASLKQVGTETSEAVNDWILHLLTVEETEGEIVQSYAVMAYTTLDCCSIEQSTNVVSTEHKVYTIGDPYYVYVTDSTQNEIKDYTDNPLQLTLGYSADMLTAAGINEELTEKLAIYRYEKELCGYVCIGGEVDEADKSVTVTITKPGQYVLAADVKAPAVTKISVEENSNKPLVTIGFDEDGGFSEFSLKVDGVECLDENSFNKYYNAPLKEVIYQLETELEEGEHTLTVYAVDDSGNAMATPFEYVFNTDLTAPILKDLSLDLEEDELRMEVYSDDKDIKMVTATVSQTLSNEKTKKANVVMLLAEGCYRASLVTDEKFASASVRVVAIDKAGNVAEAITMSIEAGDESDKELLNGLQYRFVDGEGEDGSQYTYKGAAIKPKVEIYDGKTLLQVSKDYTLTYKNNVKVANADKKKNPPTIIVKGKGNYEGTQAINFTILQRSIKTDKDISSEDILLKANGKVQKKVPVVKYKGKKLKYKTDFTVSYPDLEDDENAYKAPGAYTILVKGKGGYTGEREVKLIITESKLMSKVTVSKIATQPYTGEEVTTATMTKAPTVKYGKSTVLKEGIHYTVKYSNNINIGTATMILTGTDTQTEEGIFTGTKKVTFKISGTSLAKAKVTGIPTSMIYTGLEIAEQTENWGDPIKVVLKGEELTRAADAESDGDYIVTFKNNVKKGTATVTIKGVNAYSGSIKKTFAINAYNINDNAGKNLVTETMETNTVYAKGGSKPEPVVKFGETTLIKGTDYTLEYKNHTKQNDGTGTKKPTVTIKGKGNFKGSVKLTYIIDRQDIGNMKITVPDVVYKKKKGAYKSTPVVKDLDNKTLKAKTDYSNVYTYTYGQNVTLTNGTIRNENDPVGVSDIVPADTLIRIKVTGKGNYTDNTPLVGEYRVVKSSISKAKVTVPSQPYTGKSITIEDKTKINVKVGKTKLDPEDFEIVDGSFKNNTKAGTASFTIKGVGNYGGTKKVTFKIKPKGFIWWWRNLFE